MYSRGIFTGEMNIVFVDSPCTYPLMEKSVPMNSGWYKSSMM